MSDPKPELKRECPHCHGSLERYEDPVAVKLLADRDREIERLRESSVRDKQEIASLVLERDSLRAQLAASEKACAEMREALEGYAQCSDGCTCGDGWSHQAAIDALKSDAGRDHIPRERLSEAISIIRAYASQQATAALDIRAEQFLAQNQPPQ